jgi:hypothetical protein
LAGRMWVGEENSAGKGRQDNVSHLHTVGGNGLAYLEIVFAEEFGEVVQEKQKYAQDALP